MNVSYLAAWYDEQTKAWVRVPCEGPSMPAHEAGESQEAHRKRMRRWMRAITDPLGAASTCILFVRDVYGEVI